MKKIKVGWQENIQYNVIISTDSWRELLQDLVADYHTLLLISDENVYGLYRAELIDFLQQVKSRVFRIIIPPGEESKSLQTFGDIIGDLSRMAVTRDTLVILLGGGIVGDLGGFVAGTYLRGLSFINLPTTLLAQVDSSLGGKVGINLPEGKNLLGGFHHPRAVIINPGFLQTLPADEFRMGMAEIIKCGFIWDGEILKLLEQFYYQPANPVKSPGIEQKEILLGKMEVLEELIWLTCRGKLEVVKQDVHDRGVRRLLNFGHTVGHGLERLSGFQLRHGDAVALGMVCETFFGYLLGLISYDKYEEVREKVRLWCFHPGWKEIRKRWSDDYLMQELPGAVKKDKKVRGGRIVFSCPQAGERGIVYDGLSEEEFKALLGEFFRSEVENCW